MSEPENAEEKALADRVEKAITELGEHFENVHLFVCGENANGDGWYHISQGRGNFFARYGQIRTWLIKQDERSRMEVREDE